MKKHILGTLLFVPFLLAGCTSSNNQPNLSHEHLVYATLWFQSSPEAEALFYQGFNIAKERVVEYNKTQGEKPNAVVVDLDETMIDNSAFQGKMIENGESYSPALWAEWTQLAKAKATPGAVEFTHFCESQGVEVIYLSNRLTSELESTMRNMDSLGFTFIKPQNFLLVDKSSAKQPRRDLVIEKFEIILLIGDNLNDFSVVFENRGEDWGISAVEANREEFGRRFIILPNPMYGEWEKSVYKHKNGLSEREKFKMRRESINAY